MIIACYTIDSLQHLRSHYREVACIIFDSRPALKTIDRTNDTTAAFVFEKFFDTSFGQTVGDQLYCETSDENFLHRTVYGPLNVVMISCSSSHLLALVLNNCGNICKKIFL